jgi:hypothetical protein
VQKFLAPCNHLISTSSNVVLTVTRDVFKHAAADFRCIAADPGVHHSHIL